MKSTNTNSQDMSDQESYCSEYGQEISDDELLERIPSKNGDGYGYDLIYKGYDDDHVEFLPLMERVCARYQDLRSENSKLVLAEFIENDIFDEDEQYYQ